LVGDDWVVMYAIWKGGEEGGEERKRIVFLFLDF